MLRKLHSGWFGLLLISFQVLFAHSSVLADIIPADRKADWHPGVRGGIPAYTTVFCNVRLSIPGTNITAKADGVTDDSGAIQAAIDLAPRQSIVYLPPGTYALSNKLTFHYSKGRQAIVLRGAGPDRTRLIYMGPNGANYAVIEIRMTDHWDKFDVTGALSKGSSNLTFSATGAVPGVYYLIDELNPAGLVDTKGNSYLSRESGTRCIGQLSKVVSVDQRNVIISPPLYLSLDAANKPQAFRMMAGDANIGIEDLYIENRYDSSIYSVFMIFAAGCWVRNVESFNTGSDHVYLQSCAGCEVRDSYFHHALSYDSGRGYGVHLVRQTTDCLMENNIFYSLRHAMITEGAGPGNVFGYNFSDQTHSGAVGENWMSHDLAGHGAHTFMCLYEGNIVRRLFYDYALGSSSHNTVFRNWIVLKGKSGQTEVTLARWGEVAKFNYYHNFVGNVYGTNGAQGSYELSNFVDHTPVVAFKLGYDYGQFEGTPADPQVSSTILRTGNYEFFTQQTHWDPGISDRVIPNSLYLAGKPSWWGDLNWPPIGPDCTPVNGTIPAQVKFNLLNSGTGVVPPKNLRPK